MLHNLHIRCCRVHSTAFENVFHFGNDVMLQKSVTVVTMLSHLHIPVTAVTLTIMFFAESVMEHVSGQGSRICIDKADQPRHCCWSAWHV